MLDENTRREIDDTCWRMLTDAGISAPPVSVEEVLSHLDLCREFYDLQNPSFLDRAKHKIIVSGRKLIDVVKKIKLAAVLLFDENRVVVDVALPAIKRDWPSFHEAAHRLLKWHKPYFFGDTAQTLSPDWQQRLEAEANYGASTMMFCGPVFTSEARDTKPEIESIKRLRTRYRKSFQTTLRRYVEEGPEYPMALLVSTAPWDSKPLDQPERCRHFVKSRLFAGRFGTVHQATLLREVDANVTRRRGGAVGQFMLEITDTNGDRHDFLADSFYNTYYIMTLLVHVNALTVGRVIVPGSPNSYVG